MTEKYNTGPRGQWKSEEYGDFKPTVYDWCRMAAYIDGEGCVQINPYSGRRGGAGGIMQIRVLVHNTNLALPLWCKATFGGNIVTLDRAKWGENWKPAHVWSCTSGRAAWILFNCLPWFLLKRPQAELLMSLQESLDANRQGRGRTLTDAQVEYRKSIHEQMKLLNAKGKRQEE